jgi:hypothetical protein
MTPIQYPSRSVNLLSLTSTHLSLVPTTLTLRQPFSTTGSRQETTAIPIMSIKRTAKMTEAWASSQHLRHQ